MSRLARKPIMIPSGVSVSREGELWAFKGPKGEIKKPVSSVVSVIEETTEKGEKVLKISLIKERAKRVKNAEALLGTAAALMKNAISGVSQGFEKKLVIEGVGFKAQMEGKDLTLSLGFSHPVKVRAVEGVNLNVEKNTVTVSGADKEAVGHMAAVIRSKKPPEPYKGKGIRYENEIIRRKAGKRAAATA